MVRRPASRRVTAAAAPTKTAASIADLAEQMKEQLEGGLGAFLTTLETPELRERTLQAMSTVTAALSEHWQDQGGQMAQTLSTALVDAEAFAKLGRLLPMRYEEFQATMTKGAAGAAEVLQTMATRLQVLRDTNPAHLAQVMQALEFEGDISTFAEMLDGMQGAVTTAKELQPEMIGLNGAMEEMVETSKGQLSGFEQFKNSVGAWFTEKLGTRMVAFFDEFNPQVIVSTAYLVKMGAEAVVAGTKLLFNLGGALGKIAGKFAGFTKATQTAGVATAAPKGLTAAIGGLGGIVGKVGVGIKGLIAGVGTGIGRAIAGFFTGIATGIMVLLPAIQALGTMMVTGVGAIGFAALIGVLFAVAGAARLAAPFVVAIGEAFATMFTAMLSGFAELKPTQMLAMAGSMTVLGPAFVGLGVGVVALSGALALSVPGFALFAGAMKLLGGKGLTGLSGVIAGLMEAFYVPPGTMKVALASMRGAVEFVAGFTKLGAGLAVAAGGVIAGKIVGGIFNLFGRHSPMEMLVMEAPQIANTVTGLAAGFNITDAQLRDLQAVTKTVSATATFTKDYAAIVSSVRGLSLGALKSNVIDGILKTLGAKTSPMAMLIKEAPTIKKTVIKLVDSMAGLPSEGLEKVSKTVGALARFTSNYQMIAEGLRDVAPGLIAQQAEKILSFWGLRESPMKKLADGAPQMASTVGSLLTTFAGMKDIVAAMGEPALQAITMSSKVIRGFIPLAEAVEESADAVASLVDGRIFAGPLTDIGKGIEPFALTMHKVFLNLSGMLRGFSDKQLATIQVGVETASTMLTSLATAAKKIEPLSDVLARAKSSAESLKENAPEVLSALRSVIEVGGEIGGVTQQLRRPMVARAEITKAVTVQLDPNTTDEPVNDKLGETNNLLTQILAALQRGGAPVLARAPAGAGARARTDPRVADVGGGRVF
ncbi:hypothetical protein LCGC14_0734410 [marine sediment metagenome]|uniref:Uncharacterized protein n=1 Tax=marine sediment metagenome TaxID=412755 RepID=A0A0F9QTL0_9ZZZZ